MRKGILLFVLLVITAIANAQIFYSTINSIGYKFLHIYTTPGTYTVKVSMNYGKTGEVKKTAFPPSVLKHGDTSEVTGSLLMLEPATEYEIAYNFDFGDGSILGGTKKITTRSEPLINATSTIKYVSPTGTGTSYTSSNPGNLKTLLASGLSCGTTVFLKGGTYSIGDMQLNLLKDCSSDSPIVIMAAPNETPILDGGDSTQYVWTKSTTDTNLYYTTIKPELEYNSLCLMDSTRLYPYGYLTPSNIDPSYPCLTSLNFDLSGFYRNANLVYIKTLDHKDPNKSNIVFSKYFYCMQVQGNMHNNFVYIKGIAFKNYGKGSCTKDIFGNPTCYPSFTVDFENASNVIIDSCRFDYCNIPITFGHSSNANIIQHCTFIDGVGTWSHGAFKQTRDENILERGTYGRYLEYSSIHLFPDDTVQKGNIVRYNYVKGSIGGLVGERVTGNESIEETDIYDNRVTYSYNGINADGGSINTRIWGNEVDHCSVGLSFISAQYGPNYIFRNCIHHIIERRNYHYDVFFDDCNNVLSNKIWGTGVKLNASPITNSPPDVFFVNNTFHTQDSIGFCMYLWNHTWKKLYSRNNIFYSEGMSSFFFDDPKNDSAYSFDSQYDNYFNTRTGAIATVQPTNGIPVCNSYTSGTVLGLGLKATSAAKDVSVTNDINKTPGFVDPLSDFHLKTKSGMVDAGIVVDGFHLTYRGNAPDVGAYEADTGKVVNGIATKTNTVGSKLRVYPNPANYELRITNYDGVLEAFTGKAFSILNVLGQTMMTGKLEREVTAINVSALLPGIYFVKVGNEVAKFIKE